MKDDQVGFLPSTVGFPKLILRQQLRVEDIFHSKLEMGFVGIVGRDSLVLAVFWFLNIGFVVSR